MKFLRWMNSFALEGRNPYTPSWTSRIYKSVKFPLGKIKNVGQVPSWSVSVLMDVIRSRNLTRDFPLHDRRHLGHRLTKVFYSLFI